MLFADGFDKALIGVVRCFNQTYPLYDYQKCVEVLEEANLSQEEAIEYLEYNVLGAFVGEGMPCFAVLGDEGMEMLD
jgi:hypothetical protein